MLKYNCLSILRTTYLTALTTMRATWSWGSRVKLIFNWGDGTSDEAIHTNNDRESEFTHVYDSIGTYYPTVSIWNYLLDCSNQTLQLASGGKFLPVHILIPILEFRISPVLQAWERTIPFDLVVSFQNGTWLNIIIDWNDTSSSILYIDVVPGDYQVLLFLILLILIRTIDQVIINFRQNKEKLLVINYRYKKLTTIERQFLANKPIQNHK